MFISGFVKIAAPRWFKELKKNPKAFRKMFFGGISARSERVEAAIKRGLGRDEVGEWVFGIPKRRMHKSFPLSEFTNPADLPMTSPMRRALYFKANGTHYRQEHMRRHSGVTESDFSENLKNSATKAKDYLEGRDRAKFTHPFKALNSNKKIKVEHIAPRKAIKSIELGNIKRSPSAGAHGMTRVGLFAFPHSSRDKRFFAGDKKSREGLGFGSVKAEVPESSLEYHPPTVSKRKQKDAELYVYRDAWRKKK